MKILKQLIFLSLYMGAILCCRKQKNATTGASLQQQIHKVFVHDPSSTYDRTYTFLYDASGRPDTMYTLENKSHYIDTADSDKTLTTFIYSADHYSVSMLYPPSYSGSPLFSVYMNSNGTIRNISLPGTGDSTWFTYDGAGHMLTQNTYYAIGPVPGTTTYSYHWNGGNIDSFGQPGSGKGFYYYDHSKTGQAGDVFEINNFISTGIRYPVTANVPLYYCITNATTIPFTVDTATRYHYQYDAQGRVTQLSYTSYPGDSIYYQYEYY